MCGYFLLLAVRNRLDISKRHLHLVCFDLFPHSSPSPPSQVPSLDGPLCAGQISDCGCVHSYLVVRSASFY